MKKGVDHTGVAIVFYCHDGKGNFVMGKRSSESRDEMGVWDVGGGALEFDEKVEDTLRKEIREEYCAEVISYEFLGYRDVHRIHDGEKTHWLALDFQALVDPLQVKNGEPHKHDEIGWFTRKNMPEEVHSEIPIFFEKYKEWF